MDESRYVKPYPGTAKFGSGPATAVCIKVSELRKRNPTPVQNVLEWLADTAGRFWRLSVKDEKTGQTASGPFRGRNGATRSLARARSARAPKCPNTPTRSPVRAPRRRLQTHRPHRGTARQRDRVLVRPRTAMPRPTAGRRTRRARPRPLRPVHDIIETCLRPSSRISQTVSSNGDPPALGYSYPGVG